MWLTLVNLEYVNPATSMPDELLTPRGGALDSRVALVIPGDLSVASGAHARTTPSTGWRRHAGSDAGAIAPAASADDQEDDADDDNLGI